MATALIYITSVSTMGTSLPPNYLNWLHNVNDISTGSRKNSLQGPYHIKTGVIGIYLVNCIIFCQMSFKVGTALCQPVSGWHLLWSMHVECLFDTWPLEQECMWYCVSQVHCCMCNLYNRVYMFMWTQHCLAFTENIALLRSQLSEFTKNLFLKLSEIMVHVVLSIVIRLADIK